MSELGWGMHAAILVALVVNLWFGGDIVEARFGHVVRSALELALIGGWLILVVGMRAPWPFSWRWRPGPPDDADGDDRR